MSVARPVCTSAYTASRGVRRAREDQLGLASRRISSKNWVDFRCCRDSEWSVQPRSACLPAVDSPGVDP